MNRLWIALAPLLLAGCPGDGGDGRASGPAACTSVNTSRSYINSGGVGCGITNPGDVADGGLYSFADVTLADSNAQCWIGAGNGGTVLPAGTRAGAFITSNVAMNSTVSSSSFTVRTYLAGAVVETAAAPDIQATQGGTDADYYVSFQTAASFDAVEFVATYTGAEQLSSADVRVYEICSSGHI